MAWMADRFDAPGELYRSATQSLAPAFAPGGKFHDGANGDGTSTPG